MSKKLMVAWRPPIQRTPLASLIDTWSHVRIAPNTSGSRVDLPSLACTRYTSGVSLRACSHNLTSAGLRDETGTHIFVARMPPLSTESLRRSCHRGSPRPRRALPLQRCHRPGRSTQDAQVRCTRCPTEYARCCACNGQQRRLGATPVLGEVWGSLRTT